MDTDQEALLWVWEEDPKELEGTALGSGGQARGRRMPLSLVSNLLSVRSRGRFWNENAGV